MIRFTRLVVSRIVPSSAVTAPFAAASAAASGSLFRPTRLLHASTPTGAAAAAPGSPIGDKEDATAALFKRGADARGEIAALWRAELDVKSRVAALQKFLTKYGISDTADRTADVTPALGEAVDRLLLLTVPILGNDTTQLETVLGVVGKNGIPLSIRTIQHLFSRVQTYPEAIAVFYAMRKKNVAMDMHAYHAMIYSLQRLEEESWAMRFAEERTSSPDSLVSEQALDFIMNGTDNQLLPENKPWLGRMMFADCDQALTKTQTNESFDLLGSLWVDRYRQGNAAAFPRPGSRKPKAPQQPRI